MSTFTGDAHELMHFPETCSIFQHPNRNAWLTLTALLILHALMRNVKTHALHCHVESELNARSNATEPFVSVNQVLLATPTKYVKNVR